MYIYKKYSSVCLCISSLFPLWCSALTIIIFIIAAQACIHALKLKPVTVI